MSAKKLYPFDDLLHKSEFTWPIRNGVSASEMQRRLINAFRYRNPPYPFGISVKRRGQNIVVKRKEAP